MRKAGGQSRSAAHLGSWRTEAWELTGQVVSDQRDSDVDQIVQPSRHERCAVIGNGGDELGLEQLVAVEEDVVAVPAASGCNYARAEVGEGKLEGLCIVAGNL